MRVLVCGGRDYDDYEAVRRELDACATRAAMLRTVLTVIHGGARGADSLAERWCKEHPNNLWTEVYYADWNVLGKAAGPMRNQQMINEGRPGSVIAFPGGRGTADMIRRAEAAGIEVRRIK